MNETKKTWNRNDTFLIVEKEANYLVCRIFLISIADTIVPVNITEIEANSSNVVLNKF